jgi:protein-L-isoaspartate(D-aspartate) O-methyltransferase
MRDYQRDRDRMVDEQIARRGVRDERVLEAMRTVPRHEFVAPGSADSAYSDFPLHIPERQTISQPYIVAVMTEAARIRPDDRVLEIGTGSGYAAAVLAVLAARVFTIERIPSLAATAAARLAAYENVTVVTGDGTLGLPGEAPFDAILVTAAGPEIPAPLREQMAIGGRLVLPRDIPNGGQRLVRVTRLADTEWEQEILIPVTFVPLIGEHGVQR